VLAGLLLLWGCSGERQLSPQEIFEHAQLTLLHGDLVRAQAEAEKANRRFSGQDDEWAWKFRLLEAECLGLRGLSQDVLTLLHPALPPQLADGDLSIRKHMLQALAYAGLGDFGQADHDMAEAERLCDLSHSTLAAEVARASGSVEWKRGNLTAAESSYRKSLLLAQARADASIEATDLMNLSVVAMAEGHWDESAGWSNAAGKMFEAMGSRLDEEKILGNLGWAYYKMGDYAKSLSLYQDAEKRARILGVTADQVRWIDYAGLVYYQTGELSVAEDYYRQSLELARKIQDGGQIIDALTWLAVLSADSGNIEQAKEYSQEAFQLAHRKGDRSSELPPLLVQGKIAARTQQTKEAESVFLEVIHDRQSDVSLRWEGQNSLARLHEEQHRIDLAEKEYREAITTVESARSSLQREDFQLPFMANAAHLYDDYIHFLLTQGKTAEALEIADFSRARTLAGGLGVLRKASFDVPAALWPRQVARRVGGTILFYWLGPKESFLWAVTSDRIVQFQLPSVAEIDAAVERYRKALLGPRDVLQTANPEGVKLFEILVAPARQAIAPNSRVVIVADGSLNNLNFETLLVSEPKLHYWIEDVTIVNASSLRLLAASHASSRASAGKLLLIGDAVAPNHEYEELPKAAAEIENIEKHFAPAGRQVFTRAQATAPAYLGSSPEQFAYIHFVAHGTASRLSPLDSAVILSKASAEEDSFKLYARDIIQHPLHAELVTISTCYGAGARAYTGEGLVGLSWAFLRAGAHNVIGALWEVSDASTPRLMDQLYEGLKEGQSPEAALRAAKLSLLHSDGVFRKPFYWAPFQLYTGS
jgi:CHAT domain-containing protein